MEPLPVQSGTLGLSEGPVLCILAAGSAATCRAILRILKRSSY